MEVTFTYTGAQIDYQKLIIKNCWYLDQELTLNLNINSRNLVKENIANVVIRTDTRRLFAQYFEYYGKVLRNLKHAEIYVIFDTKFCKSL